MDDALRKIERAFLADPIEHGPAYRAAARRSGQDPWAALAAVLHSRCASVSLPAWVRNGLNLIARGYSATEAPLPQLDQTGRIFYLEAMAERHAAQARARERHERRHQKRGPRGR